MARRIEPNRGTVTRSRAGGLDVRNGGYRPRGPGRSGRGTLAIMAVLGVVIILAVIALPPLLGGFFRGLAEDNPDWLRLPFVADAVRDDLGDRLDQPAGTDETPVEFIIAPNTSARQITDDLVERGIVADRLAFSYVLINEGFGSRLRAGTHTLSRSMSPRQVAEELQAAPSQSSGLTVALRDGLRLEQVTAYLFTVEQLQFDPADFYALASEPSAELVAAYPMLATLPAGRSLEGYLSFGLFQVERDIDAAGFLRTLLDRRQAEIAELLERDPPAGLEDFYQVMTLASLVEREAALDREKPLIAGVFQNRLDGLEGGRRLLNSDSAIIYAKDTMRLREQELPEWVSYVFWTFDGLDDIANFRPADDLTGYQTWSSRGLPPGPICSPTRTSIEAALDPDTADGYLYFLSKLDGSREHVFAETYEQHLENIEIWLRGDGTPAPASPTP